MAQSRKQQQSSYSSTNGKVFGLKWFWWLLIVIGVILIFSSISIGVGSGGIAGNISRAFLGFADGILNMLEKSPIFWVFAVILLFPFLGRGVSSLYALYKGHFGAEKKQSDVVREAGIDKETLDRDVKEGKEKELSDKEIREKTLNERATEMGNVTLERKQQELQAKINSGETTFEAGVKELKEYSERVDQAVEDFNRDHEAEAEKPEPRELEPKAP